jgi:predicted RND superfamily exporter protein
MRSRAEHELKLEMQVAAGDPGRTRIPDELVRVSIRRPWLVIGFWLLLGLATIPGLRMLQVDTSTDSVLDRRDPAWQTYQHSQDLFGTDELIAVALTGERPYDPDVLALVSRLGEQIEALEGVRRVDSIATVPVIRVDASGALHLTPPLEDAPSDAAAMSAHVEERLRGDRIAPRSLVSEDGRTFAINAMLERGTDLLHAELLEQMHRLIDDQGGILSGVPVFRVAVNERTGSEILLFAPLTGFIIAAFLIIVFRRIEAVPMAVAPGLAGAWIMAAVMGATGVPLSITTMVLPSIILALGCAYSMHLLSAASGVSDPSELEQALHGTTLPVALSGLTTAVGLVSIAVIRIDAVRFTGSYGALGVFVVTAATLTLVPAALSLRPLPTLPPRGFSWSRSRVVPWLVDRVAPHRTPIVLFWSALTLLMAFELATVEVETDATAWLPVGHPVRDNYDEIGLRLSGISPVNVVIEVEGESSVLAPPALEAIDRLTAYLDALPEIGKAISVADVLRQIHGGFQSDPSLPLPLDSNLVAQYLLLLESMDQIDDLVTSDRRAANVLLRVDDNGSKHLIEVGRLAVQWWEENGPTGYLVQPTGIMYEFARAEDEMAFGQIRGLAFAILAISIIMLAIFRWPKLAAISLIPNTIPLVVIFGAMGLIGLPLDAGSVMLGGLALGVAVDDTIHIATGFYQHARQGASVEDALRETLEKVLPAIGATTLMISLAFVVLGLSEFTITRHLGLLTAGIMVLCLLADLTLLTCLLLRLDPKGHASARDAHEAPDGLDSSENAPIV